jgi:DNA-binding LacI/PurR family transcriptional regulator
VEPPSRRTRHIRISEVAAHAEVSNATVSRVLNDVPSVDPKLAERVRAAISELNYRPNPQAQGLVRGSTRAIGVLLPDLANPFFHGVVKALSERATSHGYSLMVSDSDEDRDGELRQANELTRRSDGLILCSPRMPSEQVERLLHGGQTMLALNRRFPELPIPSVRCDGHAGMASLARYLADLGHRRVAYLGGPEHSASNAERWLALQERSDLEVELVPCGSSMDDGHAAVDRALSSEPTALIAYNDIVAFGALSRLNELGLRVPDDLSVSGFDDIPYARHCAPQLTTVRTPATAIGHRAWERLLTLLAGEEGTDDIVLPTELIVRSSTGPPLAVSRGRSRTARA